MRWTTVNCVVLACLATAMATETNEPARPKRDLQFWKSLIAAKLGLTEIRPVVQNEERVKLIRMPGFENVIVKAVPKVTVVEAPPPIPERIVQVNPSMAILESYLGTKTPDQTLLALQGMKQLMESGILNARQDVQMMPRPPPVFVYPQMMREEFAYPEPRPMMIPIPMQMPMPMPMPMPIAPRYPVYPMPLPAPSPALRPVPYPMMPMQPFQVPQPQFIQIPPVMPPPVPIMPPPMPIVPDIVVPEVKPVAVPPPVLLPAVPTKYSYHHVKNDGSAMSYFSKGSADVVLIETNKPPPPPPLHIIDRFRKIMYGLPLGVPVSAEPVVLPRPVPTFVIPKPVGRIPLVMFPEAPIITGPSDVKVKVDSPDKKLPKGTTEIFAAGAKFVSKPFPSTLVRDDIVLPKPLAIDSHVAIPPPSKVYVEEEEADGKKGHKFSYTQVNAEGTIVYPGTDGMKEFDIPMIVEDDSEKGKKQKSLLGYAFKISNGEGTYKTVNNEKIFYSRLEPGAPKPGFSVFPDPLSSPDNDQHKNPNNYVYIVGNNDKETTDGNPNGPDKDEYGNPFLSTKIEGEKPSGSNDESSGTESGQGTTDSEITPIKKMPPLPMPIAGENEKGPHLNAVGGAKFSYTLVKNDGAPVRFEGDEESSKHGTVIEVISGGHNKQPCRHKGSASFPCRPKRPILVQETIGKFPSAVVDVVQPLPKPPSFVVDVLQPVPKPPSIFIQRHPRPPPVVVQPIPEPPSIFVQPLPHPPNVVVKVGQKLPEAVMFAQPVFSRYIYKQLSHSNPKPFTVVPVEDVPRIKAPKGEVSVKVNPHEHFRPDGSKYLCTELHLVPGIPAAPLPPTPGAQVGPPPVVVQPIPEPPSIFVQRHPRPPPVVVQPIPEPPSIFVQRHPRPPPLVVQPIPEPPSIFVQPHPRPPPVVVKPIPKPPSIFVQRHPRPPPLVVQPIPEPPSIFVQPLPHPPNVVVKVGQKLPEAVMFAQPVFSRYIYKQLSHSNPKPFTVVPVEDVPRIKAPKGEVSVKVNPHEHFRPDGSKYLCTELHLVPGIPAAPLPPTPGAQVVPTVPNGLVYVPPMVAGVSSPTQEITAPSFSYTQVNSRLQEQSTTTEQADEVTEEPVSLSENPIVVSQDSKYSYTQSNIDGSSMTGEGTKGNTVEVTVEDAKDKSDVSRGDIPDALA